MKEIPSITKKKAMIQLYSKMSWLTPIKKCLQDKEEPEDKFEHRKLRNRVIRYTLIDEELYRPLFTLPYLKSLTKYETEYTLKEVCEVVYENHLRARIIAHKLL